MQVSTAVFGLVFFILPAATGGWILGYRQHLLATCVGIALGVFELFAWLMITDNAGDPPDIASWIIILAVFGQFSVFAWAGALVRGRHPIADCRLPKGASE